MNRPTTYRGDDINLDFLDGFEDHALRYDNALVDMPNDDGQSYISHSLNNTGSSFYNSQQLTGITGTVETSSTATTWEPCMSEYLNDPAECSDPAVDLSSPVDLLQTMLEFKMVCWVPSLRP